MDNEEMLQVLSAIANKSDPDTGEEINNLSEKAQLAIYKAIVLLNEIDHTKSKKVKKPKSTSGLNLSGEDKVLFNVLKDFRNNKSKEMDWQAYILGSNRSIEEMAFYKPSSLEELMEIHGIGEKIVKTCGEDYLSIINDSNIEDHYAKE